MLWAQNGDARAGDTAWLPSVLPGALPSGADPGRWPGTLLPPTPAGGRGDSAEAEGRTRAALSPPDFGISPALPEEVRAAGWRVAAVSSKQKIEMTTCAS